jgi:hypothetical protein
MSKLSEREWMDLLHKASLMYNEQRVHRDFQADEVYKFVEWMHKQYGNLYLKPDLTNNTHGKS